MKLSKSLITRFNRPSTMLVISKYPYQDIGASYHGVAVYTQETLEAISAETGQKFVVLVQAEYGRKLELMANGKVLVIPCFDDTLSMFDQLLATIKRFDQVSALHIHSEFYTSGNPVQMATAIPFYAALKARGKHLSYIAHNVVADFSFMAAHLGKKKTDFKLKLFEKLVPWYYRALNVVLDRFIALDESIKQRLSAYVPTKKIEVSPIWVYPQKISSQLRKSWRTKLGYDKDDLVLMVFGFMTRYKGVDWLTDAVARLQQEAGFKHVKLLLAGGPAPSQQGKKHYDRFYAELEKYAQDHEGITLTGFLPKSDLKGHFAAADVVILPYRGILGASASWASAMTYGKPFLLSEEMTPYLEASDAAVALEKLNLTTQAGVLKRNIACLRKSVTALSDSKKLRKLTQFSRSLAAARTPQARMSIDVPQLYTPQLAETSLQWKRAIPFARWFQNA